MKKWLLFAPALLALAVLANQGRAFAASNTTMCTDQLAAGTYGKVVVPEDGVCISEGPVTIRGGLFVGTNATFVLGSEDNPGDTGTIYGGVHSSDAVSVQIHFTTINGGIDLQGGSGPFGGPFEVTWNTIEDSTIHGAVTINGYNGFWQGFIRNDVHGAVTFSNNVVEDTDGNEFVSNTIHGNLNCFGNTPAPQVGDSEGDPNVVTGKESGQCASI